MTWIVVAFFVGGVFGMIAMALCFAARENDLSEMELRRKRYGICGRALVGRQCPAVCDFEMVQPSQPWPRVVIDENSIGVSQKD